MLNKGDKDKCVESESKEETGGNSSNHDTSSGDFLKDVTNEDTTCKCKDEEDNCKSDFTWSWSCTLIKSNEASKSRAEQKKYEEYNTAS